MVCVELTVTSHDVNIDIETEQQQPLNHTTMTPNHNTHLHNALTSIQSIHTLSDATIILHQLYKQLPYDDAIQLETIFHPVHPYNHSDTTHTHSTTSHTPPTPSKYTPHHSNNIAFDFAKHTLDRFYVLASLLLLQSFSSFILSSFSELIEKHVVITLYLTMLVGAGGNGSNQAAVYIIRALATHDPLVDKKPVSVIIRESCVGIVLGLLMLVLGFIRVVLFGESAYTALTISIALFVIVFVSVMLGTVLPLFLHKQLGIDSAHAGPICQVLMDVSGVLLTCMICQAMLVDPNATQQSIQKEF